MWNFEDKRHSSSASSCDLNLDDLIRCVTVGKSAVDSVSGAVHKSSPITTRVSTDPSEKTTSGDFDPLAWSLPALTAPPEVVGITKACKRLKMGDNVALQQGHSAKDGSQTDALSKKIKTADKIKRRKRLLNDEDTSLMSSPKQDTPKVKRRLCDDLPAHFTTDKDQDKLQSDTESKCSAADLPSECKFGTEGKAPKGWLPPSPDSSEEEEGKCSQSTSETTKTQINNFTVDHLLDGANPEVCSATVSIVVDISVENSQTSLDISSTEMKVEPFGIKNTTSCDPAVTSSPTEASDHSCVDSSTSSENGRFRAKLRKRIRKTLPKQQVRQTPMGLPKPLRLKKESFSIEEIYTNKNYSTPIPRAWETIFEYPKQEKDGSLRYVERKKKQRAMFFHTNPAERPKKKRHVRKKRISTRRNKINNDNDTHTKLVNVLSELDEHLKLHNLSP